MSIPSFLRHARTRNRRTHQNNSQALTWQFDCPPNEQLSPSDLAHAKLALAFLHLARAFSTVLANAHHYDTAVARLITPVVLSCTQELNELSASLFKALASSGDEEPAKTVPVALLTDAGQQWLGEALNKQTPTHRKLFAAAERLLAATIERHQPALPHNLVLLQSVMQLSDAEMGFVELGLAIEHASLDFDMFGFISKTQRIRTALEELGLKNDSRGDSRGKWLLHERSALVRSGLFEDLRYKHNDLGELLKLSKLGLSLLSEPHESIEAMASAVLEPFGHTNQSLHALEWPHLSLETTHLQDLLGHVLLQRRTGSPELGINILLHGGPGTGKTEFTRQLCQTLAQSHQAAAYSVSAKDDDGDAADREDRLASLRLSQKLAGNAPAILVLDEAEDIFQSNYNHPLAGLFGKPERESEGKAWTNNLLETNPHPVIWISNRISHLDPAYLRRFAYVLEFKNPPRSQRLGMATQHLAPVGASAGLLERLSHNSALTPAMLASSAKFVGLINGSQTRHNAPSAVDANIQHHIQLQLKALGITGASTTPELVTRFDTRYLNASGRHSAERIAAALARVQRGSVLLTGMPGTGKTQLAAHLAERCNRELIYRTAADINDMYYGQSERNVAKLFDNCDIHSQIIFLDEADTLLMTRTESSHRADRAVTSEFLRRLEAFQGIFMCATNHGDLLDPALMRRFVFRLDFAPLNPTQRTQLLQELLGGTTDRPVLINDCTQQRLNRLDRLTPGDFANCKKRLTCLDENPTAEQWVEELEQEHNVKPLLRGRVGFV